jgi:IS5 family transposase
MINRKHPLCRLAEEINWKVFEEEFGVFYVEKVGRPGLPIRLMAGLHYLKNSCNESDGSVVERFLENPYRQYFCGYEYFQYEAPIDPTSLVKWRNLVGAEGMESLLKENIESAKRKKLVREQEV